MSDDTPITELLAQIGAGDSAAMDQLMPVVYQQLKDLAAARIANERQGHTLSATALVHETYLRMVGSELPDLQDRQHFIAVAAIAMRRVLVDHARAISRGKRGGDYSRTSLSAAGAELGSDPAELLELDAALTRLASLDAQMAQVVELRWFGGMSVEDCAALMDQSARTVARRWVQARAWLLKELGSGEADYG